MQKEASEYHIGEFRVVETGHPQETFAFIDRNEKKLVVGDRLNDHEVLEILTPTDQLMQQLSAHAWGYPIGLSLIDRSGSIFLSTEEHLQREHYAQSDETLQWTAIPGMSDAWFLDTEHERFLAVALPVRGMHDTHLMLDLPAKGIAEIQLQDYLYRAGLFVFLVCAVGGGLLFLLTRRIAKPLRSLTTMMHRVSEGAEHVRYIPDRMGFELNIIGQQLNEMLDSLFASQQEAQRERVVRERLAEELKIGHQIQQSMLPTQFDIPSFEVVPGYHAALEVSGDFYDLFQIQDGRLLIAIADAAGKGISACLFSLSFRSMLRATASTQPDLVSILRRANALLLHDTALSGVFITAWIAMYDPRTRELTYCSQGHPPALLWQNERLLPLSTHGMALGAMGIDPKVDKILLHPGDLLLLYTDGVTEAHNPRGDLFGMKRLESLMNRNHMRPLTHIARILLEEVQQFCEGSPQADDLTFLFLQRKNS
jgi:serine phosphatase RsbU (regulator of sigma subunit)